MANTHSLALDVTGVQYAWIADTPSLSITGDITMEFWVKINNQPDPKRTIICKRIGAGNLRSYMIDYDDLAGTKRLRCLISDDGTNDQWVSWDYTLTSATWFHVAIVVDVSQAVATQMELYINGSTQGNGDVGGDDSATSIQDNASTFNIGASGDGAGTPVDSYDGLIDDVRVWNDIRTSTEIDDNKAIELVGNESGLAGYWKFNNSYLDETANNNDLAGAGSPTFSTDVPFAGEAPSGPSIVSWKSLLGVGR